MVERRRLRLQDILDDAKAEIAAGESRYRRAAELIAKAQAAGATQKQIADHVGKSRAWVTFLLAWRKDGYKGGAFDKSHRARMSRQARQSARPKAASSSEQVRAQEARAHADAERAKAQRAKAEAARAKAEAAKARSDNARAREESRRARHEAFGAAFGWARDRRKEVHSSTRTLIVKALGMLGSDHDGEILNAARKAEQLRKAAGLTWDELIVEAAAVAKAA